MFPHSCFPQQSMADPGERIISKIKTKKNNFTVYLVKTPERIFPLKLITSSGATQACQSVACGLLVSQDSNASGSTLANHSFSCNFKRLDSKQPADSRGPGMFQGGRVVLLPFSSLQCKGSDPLPYSCWASTPLSTLGPRGLSKNAFALDGSGNHWAIMSVHFESLGSARFSARGYREMKSMS